MNPQIEVPAVERYSQCRLPTEYGAFEVVAYREEGNPNEHLAISMGDVRGAEGLLARAHSECLTGEVLHSLKCDCREQLDLALRRVAEAGQGVVLYLRQEGRGIGLGNKIRAYEMQQKGFDTVDANKEIGFGDDLRRYHMVKAMLDDLGVASVALMTNNPTKVAALRQHGVTVTRRVPHLVQPHPLNRGYLETKRLRMGHMYDLETADFAVAPPSAMEVDYDPTLLFDAE
ncbi:MAG: GTP cyclohydrolase II [Myxococcota bacterium]